MKPSPVGVMVISVLFSIVFGALFGYVLASVAPLYVLSSLQGSENQAILLMNPLNSVLEHSAKELGIGYGMTRGAVFGFIMGIVMLTRSTFVDFKLNGGRPG